MSTLLVYRRLVGARIRAQAQYRLSFGLDVAGSLLVSFMEFATILVLFEHLPAMDSWTLDEVAFLYGTSGLAFGLCDVVVGHLDLLRDMIREGSFDVVLVRPLGALFQVVSSDFSLRKLGKVSQAGAVLAIALVRVDVDWTVARAAMVVAMVITGAAVFAAVWVGSSTITFWTVESSEMGNALTYGGSFLTAYPIGLFGAWLRRLLAYFVPLAFVAYFPALYVLDKPDPTGAPSWLRFAAPAVAAAAALVAGWLWRLAVRHYRSTGS